MGKNISPAMKQLAIEALAKIGLPDEAPKTSEIHLRTELRMIIRAHWSELMPDLNVINTATSPDEWFAFTRSRVVSRILEVAKENGYIVTMNASPGKIHRHISPILKGMDFGLKDRRITWQQTMQQITQQAAE